MTSRIFGIMIATAALLQAAPSLAGPTAAQKCEGAKNKLAGAYYSCREKAEAASISKGVPADYSKCSSNFVEKWDRAESSADGLCPDNVLTADMQAFLDDQATQAAAIIAGTDGVPTCGDGVVNAPGEQCDGADLGGMTCVNFGYDAGTLACNGSCEFDASGCPPVNYVGPQVNVPIASIGGWEQCFVEPYSGINTSLAAVAAACPKANLMLACRVAGSGTLTLLAHAPRADVLFDVGDGMTVSHNANGSQWYYSSGSSWGFAPGGAAVNRNTCDIALGSENQRLCWHTAVGTLIPGWRCGTNTNLNASTTYERVIYQHN